GSKNCDDKLLAFRYPTSKNVDQINVKEFGACTSNNDLCTGKQKEKERSVTFDDETSANIGSNSCDFNLNVSRPGKGYRSVLDISWNEFSFPGIHLEHK
ncbi:18850_t:CDS:1, partial [Acaulospora morrowiae]